VVDLHCHVLPDVDDGPGTLEESIELCRAAQRDGTHTLVATPHVNADYPYVTAQLIRDQAAAVNSELRARRIDVTVRTGAEVALSRAAELSDLELRRLALGGGPYVLLELPWTSAAAGVLGALRAFAHRGYRIVLAHPERTPLIQREPALVRDLVGAGVLCCLDAGSLAAGADRRAHDTAWQLLAQGLVHVVASDCHDAVQRSPHLASVLEGAGMNAPQIDYFACRAPEAIINGGEVTPPPVVDGRHRRRRLRRPW
jgi:protein-tyrosine phosphatase